MNQTKLPRVAIIIVNWNGAQVTLACLESLRKVEYPDYTIYVVDNASSDNSVELIRESFPEVHLIESEHNRYFAGGNNLGWEYARKDQPELILFLNNDTEVARDFLLKLVEGVNSAEDIGIAGPRIYHYDQSDLIWSAGGYINFWKGKTGHYGLRERDSEQWDQFREVGYVTGCALLIRSALFEKLNGFDESYLMYSEDVDLCYRGRLLGFRTVYVPAAKVWHKISSSTGGGLTPYKIRQKIRGNFLFFRRYARWYHWLSIPFFVFFNGIFFLSGQILKGNLKVVSALISGFFSLFRLRRSKI